MDEIVGGGVFHDGGGEPDYGRDHQQVDPFPRRQPAELFGEGFPFWRGCPGKEGCQQYVVQEKVGDEPEVVPAEVPSRVGLELQYLTVKVRKFPVKPCVTRSIYTCGGTMRNMPATRGIKSRRNRNPTKPPAVRRRIMNQVTAPEIKKSRCIRKRLSQKAHSVRTSLPVALLMCQDRLPGKDGRHGTAAHRRSRIRGASRGKFAGWVVIFMDLMQTYRYPD